MKGFFAIPKSTSTMLCGYQAQVSPRTLGVSLWLGSTSLDGTFDASPGAMRDTTNLMGSDWEFLASLAELNGKALSLYSDGSRIYGVLHGMNKSNLPASIVKKKMRDFPAPPADIAEAIGYQFEPSGKCTRTSLSMSFNSAANSLPPRETYSKGMHGLMEMPSDCYDTAVLWLRRVISTCHDMGAHVTMESTASDFGPALTAMAKESSHGFKACARHMLTEAEPWILAKRETSTRRLSRWLSRAFKWYQERQASSPGNSLRHEPLTDEERVAIIEAARGVDFGPT